MKKLDLTDFYKKHQLILAPMAGVNDPIFRELCITNGAQLTYTEMLSSKALSYNNPKTKNLLSLAKNEKKVVVQIFGHEPKVMAEEAKNIEKLLKSKLAYIDINMGCPAKKIIKKGDGAALMKTPKLAGEIVHACSESCVCPISVKLRRGFYLNEDNSLEFGQAMQKAGANSITIHGRFAMQFYKGKADVSSAIKLLNNVDVPVVWSGDVKSYTQAYDYIKNKKFNAVMIGRAARGNPWVFSSIDRPDFKKITDVARYHVVEFAKINPKGLSHMKKHCMWYFHGFPGATYARDQFSRCQNVDDYINIINKLSSMI